MNTNSFPLSSLSQGSNVWAYLRNSRLQDDKDEGIAQQQAKIEAYCALHGLNFVKVFVDATKNSAGLKRRIGILELLDQIDVPEQCPDGLLVTDISRLGRKAKDISFITSKLQQQKIVIHSLKESEFNKLYFLMLEFMGEFLQ